LYVQACEEEITEKEGSRTNEMTEEDTKQLKKHFYDKNPKNGEKR
jgi:hypothetical protein